MQVTGWVCTVNFLRGLAAVIRQSEGESVESFGWQNCLSLGEGSLFELGFPLLSESTGGLASMMRLPHTTSPVCPYSITTRPEAMVGDPPNLHAVRTVAGGQEEAHG